MSVKTVRYVSLQHWCDIYLLQLGSRPVEVVGRLVLEQERDKMWQYVYLYI